MGLINLNKGEKKVMPFPSWVIILLGRASHLFLHWLDQNGVLEQSSTYKGTILELGFKTNHSYDHSKDLSYLLFSWCMMRSCASNRIFYCFCHMNRNKTKQNQKRQWNFMLCIFHQDWILTPSLGPLNHWKVQVQFNVVKTNGRVGVFFASFCGDF